MVSLKDKNRMMSFNQVRTTTLAFSKVTPIVRPRSLIQLSVYLYIYRLTKPQTVPPASKKQDTIIYTQIIPKNLRPKPEETAPQVTLTVQLD